MPITLKELPGPKGIPVFGNLFKLDLNSLHKQIEQWSDEYGDVFHLNLGVSNFLCITRPSLIQKVYAARPNEFVRMKKMDSVIQQAGVHGVFNAEREDWKLHRSIITKGLDVKHQRDFYPGMLPVIERLHKKWEKNAESGLPFDIQRDLLRFTVDITTSLAFGFPMNTLEQEGSAIQDQMEKVFPMIFKRINMAIPWYKIIRFKSDKEFDSAVLQMNDLIEEFIVQARKRIEDNPELRVNPSNVIESILVAAEDEETFTDKDVRGNLATILLAGEDTTAHTLSWMIYLLTTRPEIQDEIRKESDGVLGADNWTKKYEDNKEFKYIEGVAMESMRFKPVAPILLFESTADIELEGILFKKGQPVLCQNRSAALKDENFTEALSLKPERWLKGQGCPVHNMDAFSPFGGGPRYCPGRNLAILEIQMVISMLFKNFNIEMMTPHKEIDEIMAFTLMSSPFEVKLTKR
ncbi:MAG: cytochrome P450 [Crocinitomicaceae bacterium]|jgi:cytochrome P450